MINLIKHWQTLKALTTWSVLAQRAVVFVANYAKHLSNL